MKIETQPPESDAWHVYQFPQTQTKLTKGLQYTLHRRQKTNENFQGEQGDLQQTH